MTLHDDELKRIAKELAAKLVDEANTKRVFKEALEEWMDRKFLEFNKSMWKGALILLFGALVIFVMWSQGYSRFK